MALPAGPRAHKHSQAQGAPQLTQSQSDLLEREKFWVRSSYLLVYYFPAEKQDFVWQICSVTGMQIICITYPNTYVFKK